MKQTIKIGLIESNKGQIEGLPANPRFIRDERFEKLRQSIREDPEMLELRPVMVFAHGKKYVAIGGNMRYEATKAEGFKEVPCEVIEPGTTPEKLRAYTVAAVYKANHSPKHLFNEDIRAFNERKDLPDELYQLDILDGSPPCSTFSMAGSREKAWGKQKQFREGQAVQTLDDLVFVYCDTIIKLQPKVFLLENVKGIIQGNAKVYSKNIVEKNDGRGLYSSGILSKCRQYGRATETGAGILYRA